MDDDNKLILERKKKLDRIKEKKKNLTHIQTHFKNLIGAHHF